MSSPPIVSVLMPIYNAERYLRDAVKSILDQTLREFELIAVDDGSTDGSGEMLEQFAATDARVRVIRRPNTGIVGALNDGLKEARGELIARMDGDDISLPSRFEHQVAFLNAHPECDLVGSRVIMMDSDGYPIGDMKEVGNTHEEIDKALMGAGWPIIHPSVMMRRRAIEAVGGYQEGTFPNEDHDLFLRLAERGRLANLGEPLLMYRRHFQSVVFKETRNSQPVLVRIIAEARQRRGITNAPPIRAGGPPRPVWMQRMEWVWVALKEGYVPTARRHALGIMRERPLSSDSWRVMYCALRGR